MTDTNQVKIQFQIDPKEQREFRTEALWAERVGDGRFRILNSPFFLFGISAEDIVEAKEAEDGFKFQSIISRGGHSTYRVFIQGGRTISAPDFQAYWKPISQLGATFENANDHFVSVDIPPGKDVAAIYKLMQKGEQEGVWTFEEVTTRVRSARVRWLIACGLKLALSMPHCGRVPADYILRWPRSRPRAEHRPAGACPCR
jgi:uncharacterized protein DUF4265